MIEMKKNLAVGIILLLISVAVAPSINTSIVKASTDDDLAEVTTQACSITGHRDTTVKLTREQYENLEQYLMEFRARLNQTATREEAIPLFKEVVVKLDKYGLLPKGMSVEKAWKLIIYQYPSQREWKSLKKNCTNQEYSLSNFCCLVAGRTTKTLYCTFITNLLVFYLYISLKMYYLFKELQSKFLAGGLQRLYNFCYFVIMYSSMFYETCFEKLEYSPIFIRSLFSPYGYCLGFMIIGYDNPFGSAPAEGWIQTVGILGHRSINGSFYGQFKANILQESTMIFDNKGIIGFQGLRIRLDNTTDNRQDNFYLGTALGIAIGLEPNN
jgi:hypothetical protein